ncbi:MAG: spermidine synthase [Actinobacteria bacterium]|nr:MAG: spermidine synthase [Actinomycetota bacterium]
MASGARLRLVLLSFLMLFVELALIRWTGANNVHLAYLTNFVLLASFLGIGVGFLRAERGPELFPWAPVALALLVGFVLAFPVDLTTLEGSGGLRGAFGMAALPLWLSLSVVFVLTTATMAGIGHGVARIFVRFSPLEAYRLDILGSIAGIVVFSALAFLELPPVAWGAIVSALFVLLLGRRIQLVALVAVVTLLAIESADSHDHWSPYYKITATHTAQTKVAGVPTHDVLTISANNIPHQTAYPIATLRRIERFYFFPYRHVDRRRLDDMLIVGAGNGNDLAVALAQGAKHVDAVEIDPVIQSLGRRYHPNRPWQDPRVSKHIDDGRAFVQRTHRKYDLILFALPDSLTLLAGQGNLRLENYLFTIESMRKVKSLLKPGGTFAMYNYYESWLLDRYAATLQTVYGRPPCVEVGDPLAGRRQAVLTAGAGATRGCRTQWHGERLSAPTDDHPFPYLRTRTIPTFYLKTLGLMLLGSLLLVRVGGGSLRGMSRYVDLAFMGAAFLLLETTNIVKFALLFGTTWFVNALVFTGVLLSVYAAVEVARHVRLPPPPVLYGLLLAALVVAWAVPQSSLLALAPVPRFFAATALAFAPIFLANLVFAQRFRNVAFSTTAFGANLLGAMAGGVLEYLALVTGYRFLLIVVALLYAAAFAATRVLPRVAAPS